MLSIILSEAPERIHNDLLAGFNFASSERPTAWFPRLRPASYLVTCHDVP